MEQPNDVKCDVEIKTPAFEINEKGMTLQDGRDLVDKVLKEHPDDKILQEWLTECKQSFGYMGRCGHGYDMAIHTYRPRIKTGEMHSCPRRMYEDDQWPDEWEMRGDDKCCSFCGSMHPDRVIELIKKHGFSAVERSTKSYKWYIKQPSVPNASYGGIKYYRYHDTPEFIESYNKLIAKT